MNRTSLALALAALMALATPATAAWSSHGQQEPNTIFDTSDRMWADLPSAPGQVYFNAFPTFVYPAYVSPNTAVAGSAVSPTPLLNWEAAFGIWTDCNGDGYIGLAESALVEYRSESLLVSATCPPGTSPHNDGAWVSELLTIGRVDTCEFESQATRNDANHPCFESGEFIKRPGVIYTNTTLLWADQGAPGETLGGSSCPIRPIPRGSFSNTGMMIRYADCFVGFRVANTINENDPTGELTFTDPKNPQMDTGSHPLVFNTPISLFGNPRDGRTGVLEQNTGNPTARVWDCSDEPTPSPSVASDPTSASVFETASAAADGLTLLNEPIQAVVDAHNTHVTPVMDEVDPGDNELFVEEFDCNDGTQNEVDAEYFSQNLYGQDTDSVGLLEGNNNPSGGGAGKVENDFVFNFFDGGYDPRDPDSQLVFGLLGEGVDPDFGTSAGHGLFGPLWTGRTLYAATPQTINRATLAASSRAYWSFYAYVDPGEIAANDFVTPSSATHNYGDANCQGATTGIVNGWDCDKANWFPDGRETYARGELRGALPGDPFQWSDVDCFDGTLLRGVPVRASATDLSPAGICDGSAPLPGA